MEGKKLWFAVMLDNEDSDHGLGFYQKEKAVKFTKNLRNDGYPEAYIAVVDDSDDFTVEEIRDF